MKFNEAIALLGATAPTDDQTARKVTKRRGSKKRAAERGERITLYLPPDLHEAVREIAFRERASSSYIVTKAVEAWVKRTAKGKP